MREIKFRAWDKTSSIMRNDISSIRFNEDGSINQIDVYSGTDILFPDKEAIVSQYTGLKDKNGVEIYEGDIVSRAGHVSTIEYRAGMFGMNNAKADRQWSYRPQPGKLFPITGGIEVIGNIYENPELLEQSNVKEK